MTISSTKSRWDYDGDGTTVGFTYNNKIFSSTDMNVYIDGDLKTLSTDYTISGVGAEAGGTVTFTSAPADDSSVVLVRNVPLTQDTDYPPGGSFPAASTEDALDKSRVIDQQLLENIDRCLQAPEGDDIASQSYDAGGRKIESLGTGKSAGDAVNVGQMDVAIAAASLGIPGDTLLQTVATLAELQASPPSSGQAYLRGFASAYDGGGGEWYKTGVTGLTASQTPAQLVDIKCTDVDGDEWALRLTDESTALQVGLVDNIDSTAAFLAWAAGVQAAGKAVLPLHAGVTRVESLTAGIPVPGSLIVQGKGKEASTMIWNDTTVGRDLWDFTGSRDFFEARDFTIRGSHDVNRSNINAYPMLVRNTERVIFKNLRSQYSRAMGIVARDALVAVATECSVDHCARDGINLANCDYTVTAGNDVSYVDDDAIAVHNQYYSDQRNHICIGNRLKFAQGIKMLGVHVASITGNTLDFCTGNAFDIQTLAATELEGGTPSFAVTAIGNTVSNHINRANIDGLNSAGDIFALSSTSAQAGTLAAIPGTRKPDGTIDSPYAYYRNVYQVGDANSTTPIPMSRGFTISNNTVMRNIERTGLLSDLGHGKFWMRDGEYDVDLSVKAATNPNFFRLPDTPVFSVNGTGNTFIGGKWFISASGNGRMVDSKLTDTTIYDCDALITAEPTTNQWGLKLEGGEVDLDPYLQHASRNTDGSWAGEGALTAMTLQGATGIELVGNTFKNMSRISDYDFNNAVRDGVLLADGNVVWSGVSTRGYSAANQGVGYIPSVGNTRVINYDADPANATFGDIINELRRDAQVQPTAGYYVTGWFVESTPATVAGTDVVYGWLRLTDGSAHVAGTDWKVAKMPLS